MILKVLHLTDPHLFADKAQDLRGTVTYSSLCDVLDHYRDCGWQADVAMVTGDLIQDDSAGAYEHFADLVGALDLPVYCLPGNHDVRDLMREALSEAPFHYCESLQQGDWLVVSLDSCITGQAGGRIEADELDRLDREIDASSASHVMVCLHHPPVLMDSRWLDSVGLENREEFLDRIAPRPLDCTYPVLTRGVPGAILPFDAFSRSLLEIHPCLGECAPRPNAATPEPGSVHAESSP